MKIEVVGDVLLVGGNPLTHDLVSAFELKTSSALGSAAWPEFSSGRADTFLGPKFDAVCDEVLALRSQARHADAIALSDKLFESLTPAMNWLAEIGRFRGLEPLWRWGFDRAAAREKAHAAIPGLGIHKGTGFFFLGVSRLLGADWDGAYLAFGEAEMEDQSLPTGVLSKHQKGIPPVVKLLLLDLSPDHFAYPVVQEIHAMVTSWETQFPQISNSLALVDVGNAIDSGKIPRAAAMSFCFGVAKAFAFELQRKTIRPTAMAMLQAQTILLSLDRTAEDVIRHAGNLGKDDKVFEYCHDRWFASERWERISAYEGRLGDLVRDFLRSSWGLSKASNNLVLTLKLRNAIAHGIPTEPSLVNSYPELTLAIIDSFAFICRST